MPEQTLACLFRFCNQNDRSVHAKTVLLFDPQQQVNRSADGYSPLGCSMALPARIVRN